MNSETDCAGGCRIELIYMRQALRVRQSQLDVYVLPTAWGGPETDASEDEASYGERRIASSPWTRGPEQAHGLEPRSPRASAAALLFAAAKPMLPELWRKTVCGNSRATRSPLPSKDALSMTLTSTSEESAAFR